MISIADPLGESIFLKVFGMKSPVLKILDFLMDNPGSDYSKTEIAQGADLSRGTLFAIWPKLEHFELVIMTREVGRSRMYKLNKKNSVVKKLVELDDAVSDFYASNLINEDAKTEKCASEPHHSRIDEQLAPEKEPVVS